jgi:hypothetical protein
MLIGLADSNVSLSLERQCGITVSLGQNVNSSNSFFNV